MEDLSFQRVEEYTKENPVRLNLSDSTNKDFIRGVTPDMDPTLLKIQIESNILNHFNFGTKGTINNFNPESQPYFDKQGNLHIPDTYTFSDKGDIADKPIIGNYTTGDVTDGLSFGNEELRKDILTKFDQSVGAFVPGTPGRKDPMMNIDIVIPKENFSQSQNESFIMESVSVNERRNVSRGGMSFPSQLTDGLNDHFLTTSIK